MRFLCPTFFTPLSLCGVVYIEIRQKTSTRDTRIKNVLRIHVSQNRAGREFRRNSGEITQYQGMFLSLPFARKVLIFFFSCFCGRRKRKESNLVAKWSAWFHSSFTSRAKRWTRDGRTTVRFCPEIYSSRKCVRRKRYFRASLASRSGFPKRAQRTTAERNLRLKTSKRGLLSRFQPFAYPFHKKQISHQILSYVYSFKHRLQSPRCAWLKTKT